MGFKKGEPRLPGAGRQPGSPNKLTRTVKEVVLAAFNELQQDPHANLLEWGRKNPKDFYPIAAKLIPSEVTAQVTATVGSHDFSKYSYEQLRELLAGSTTGNSSGNLPEETH